MSITVDQAFVQQYSDMVVHLYQQRFPRLRRHVRMKTGVTGERCSFERLGDTDMLEITERHSSTQYLDPDHTKRWVNKRDFDHAVLIDRTDAMELLIDPESAYLENGARAMARKGDQLIIAAAEGNAFQGKSTTTTVALPAGQIVAAGAVGLNVTKFRQAMEILSLAEVGLDDMDMGVQDAFCAVIGPTQMRNLLAETEATSIDYVDTDGMRKPLMMGRIPYFYGFRIVQSNLLTLTGTSRQTLFFHRDAIGLAIWDMQFMSIDELPTMRHSRQVYMAMSMNATRVLDEGVVQVLCTE